MDEDQVWRRLLALAGRSPTGACSLRASADELIVAAADESARRLVDLYLPLCRSCPERFVVGHLGQSLDGRIATANGSSHWVTGTEDIVHNHRMRALFDAVVVGAGTVQTDDPRLTVRAVAGVSPVRVVLDRRRRLSAAHRVFQDDAAPTLALCDVELVGTGERLGRAEVIGVAAGNGSLDPRRVLDRLAELGLRRVFIEGGGVTVSRFLAAACLDRLQIVVAPLILGSGRPGITLPEIDRLSAGLRPPTRSVPLGRDVLFECRFNA